MTRTHARDTNYDDERMEKKKNLDDGLTSLSLSLSAVKQTDRQTNKQTIKHKQAGEIYVKKNKQTNKRRRPSVT